MATIERNADGSAIAKLSEPIKVNGEDVSRVTIPRIKGKHMMHLAINSGQMSVGQMVAFAGHVVEPKGAVEEMSPSDALDVAMAVVQALGESRPTGAPASP